MAGRRPKPTHLKLINGNPGRRPVNKKEPKPTKRAPRMPGHLSVDAKAAWAFWQKELLSLGVLTVADGCALERLCECYATVVHLQQVIRREGETYEAPTQGGAVMVRARPEVGMLADVDRRLKGYLIEFGLTPAARSKVQTNAQQEEDPTEGYF